MNFEVKNEVNTFLINIPVGDDAYENQTLREVANINDGGTEMPVMVTHILPPESYDVPNNENPEWYNKINPVLEAEDLSEVLSRTGQALRTYCGKREKIKTELVSSKKAEDNQFGFYKKPKRTKISKYKVKDLSSRFPGRIRFGKHRISINFLDESLVETGVDVEQSTNNNEIVNNTDKDFPVGLDVDIKEEIDTDLVELLESVSPNEDLEKYKVELEATKSELNIKNEEVQQLSEELEKEKQSKEELLKMLENIQREAGKGSDFAQLLLQMRKT